MSHRSEWWYPNYIEYGTGLNPPRTWPTVMEQYRKPDTIRDLRHYDLPTSESEDALYFRYPRLLPPKYRGLFRDKPHCVASYYPGGQDLPEGKPRGFHGRMYYEDGPPQFKYQGPKVNELYYLEQPPYLPTSHSQSAKHYDPCKLDTSRGLNSPGQRRFSHQLPMSSLQTRSTDSGFSSTTPKTDTLRTASTYSSCNCPSKRLTQDGIGYL